MQIIYTQKHTNAASKRLLVSSYKILQNTDINPVMKSLLSDTEIIEEDNIVIFKSNKNDISHVHIKRTIPPTKP